MSVEGYEKFKLIKVIEADQFVYKVILNRPKKFNALNLEIWNEIGRVFEKIDEDSNCRCVILEGEGKHFTAGLDLSEAGSTLSTDGDDDVARKARKLLKIIKKMQNDFSLIEKCSKPVLVGVHGYCLGGGIDIITACDIRFSTKNSIFSVKEVDIGMAADVGTLNRLPKIIGNHSWMRELSYTARNFDGEEALKFGLVSRIFSTRDEMMSELLKLAVTIASKSPIGVQGTKIVLNYSKDHTTDESLNFVANWNMSQLMTDDVAQAAMAVMTKQKSPNFSKL